MMESPEDVDRLMALWLLLKPAIEAEAKKHGATPRQATVAMLLGLPTMVLGSSPDGKEEEYMGAARKLFEHCCKIILVQGEN